LDNILVHTEIFKNGSSNCKCQYNNAVFQLKINISSHYLNCSVKFSCARWCVVGKFRARQRDVWSLAWYVATMNSTLPFQRPLQSRSTAFLLALHPSAAHATNVNKVWKIFYTSALDMAELKTGCTCS